MQEIEPFARLEKLLSTPSAECKPTERVGSNGEVSLRTSFAVGKFAFTVTSMTLSCDEGSG